MRWQGNARVRAAIDGETVAVQFTGATSGSREPARRAAELFRRDFPRRGPDYRPYAVHVWIEGVERNRRLDVDNVAKAALDALTGLVWRDDRQVVRLVVEKFAEGAPRVTVLARPAELPADAPGLDTPPFTLDHDRGSTTLDGREPTSRGDGS